MTLFLIDAAAWIGRLLSGALLVASGTVGVFTVWSVVHDRPDWWAAAMLLAIAAVGAVAAFRIDAWVIATANRLRRTVIRVQPRGFDVTLTRVDTRVGHPHQDHTATPRTDPGAQSPA